LITKTESLLYGNEYVKENMDNTVYPGDCIGVRYFRKKAKKEWKADVYQSHSSRLTYLDRWQTKNYFGFLNVEGNQK
jgi:hypothetical protein